eukprot:CAMPEP_0117427946 /NCGR_PEP_ID=MMETSP0758-20121206/7736_1 /TAXON_ID=63605 /ORGANISM="Percolomonas cosmopolitus, Strain AE-1 (ATCC 50343)" /LENGTH=55 /DNA_ID=CAMNT_0005213975 /DNA_START=533 /DNA_END=700 /DNA_ORIENTATION=-
MKQLGEKTEDYEAQMRKEIASYIKEMQAIDKASKEDLEAQYNSYVQEYGDPTKQA